MPEKPKKNQKEKLPYAAPYAKDLMDNAIYAAGCWFGDTTDGCDSGGLASSDCHSGNCPGPGEPGPECCISGSTPDLACYTGGSLGGGCNEGGAFGTGCSVGESATECVDGNGPG